VREAHRSGTEVAQEAAWEAVQEQRRRQCSEAASRQRGRDGTGEMAQGEMAQGEMSGRWHSEMVRVRCAGREMAGQGEGKSLPLNCEGRHKANTRPR